MQHLGAKIARDFKLSKLCSENGGIYGANLHIFWLWGRKLHAELLSKVHLAYVLVV